MIRITIIDPMTDVMIAGKNDHPIRSKSIPKIIIGIET